jgi:hypothetical protein
MNFKMATELFSAELIVIIIKRIKKKIAYVDYFIVIYICVNSFMSKA